MTTDELVRAAAKRGGFYICDMKDALTVLLEVIVETTAKGENVKLEEFGVFTVRERAERNIRDFRTGETIALPACRIPRFKAWKKYKEVVQAENGED